MKRSLAVTALALGSLLPLAASAETAVDARYGLFGWGEGFGLEVAFSAAKNGGARLTFSDTKNDYDKTYSDVSYALNYKLRTVGLLFDWRPAAGTFFLTGGLMYNNKNSLDGTASGDVTINGTLYHGVSLKAEVTWDRKIAPFFGVGWGNVGTPNKGLSWSANLGIAFIGDLNVKLTDNTGQVSPTDRGTKERSIEDDINAMRRTPMANIGIGYTF
jgi:hypothetical protein